VVLYLLLFVITVPVAYIYTVNDGHVSVAVLGELMAAIVLTYIAVRWILPLPFVRILTGIRPGRYPLWGLTYLRIWSANMLLGLAPLEVLSGSPLVPGYLRLLGAKIGRGVHLGSSGAGDALDAADRRPRVGRLWCHPPALAGAGRLGARRAHHRRRRRGGRARGASRSQESRSSPQLRP
jgi:hypothetical protein